MRAHSYPALWRVGVGGNWVLGFSRRDVLHDPCDNRHRWTICKIVAYEPSDDVLNQYQSKEWNLKLRNAQTERFARCMDISV